MDEASILYEYTIFLVQDVDCRRPRLEMTEREQAGPTSRLSDTTIHDWATNLIHNGAIAEASCLVGG